MMAKKSVEDVAELEGKKVLVRCDLNCPLDGKTITDDTRIRASVPTLKYLLEKGAKVAACSHLGRPKDGPEDKFSLGPCADRMGEYLPDSNCKLAPDCVGDEVAKMVDDMSNGELIILENTRFYKEETKNDEAFAKKFAKPFDLFVNDAFGTAHRAHASTEGVTKSLEAVSGFLLKKELDYLDGAIKNGEKPLAAIVGGSKVSSKITVLTSLIEKCNKVFIGGGMVFTFLAAQGKATGSSLVEEDFIDTAKEAMALAEKKGCGVTYLIPEGVATDLTWTFLKGFPATQGGLRVSIAKGLSAAAAAKGSSESQSSEPASVAYSDVAAAVVECLQTLPWDESRVVSLGSAGLEGGQWPPPCDDDSAKVWLVGASRVEAAVQDALSRAS